MNMHNRNLATVFPLFIILGLLITGILSARALYADGSYFLFKVLTLQNFELTDTGRSFVLFISQAPTVIAIKLGIQDLNILIGLFSFGLIGITLIIWSYALFLQRNNQIFWLLILAFSASYLSSGFFAVGEFNICYALCALCVSVMCKQNNTRIECIILMLSAFILIRSYEAVIFLAPLLFSIALFILVSGYKKKSFAKISVLISLILFLVSFIFSLHSLLFVRGTQSASDAANLLGSMKSSQFIYLFTLTLCMFISLIISNIKLKNITLILCSIFSLFFLFTTHYWQNPFANYSFRAMSGILLFAILLLIFIYYFITEKFFIIKKTQQCPQVTLMGCILIFSLSIPFFKNTFGFLDWAQKFEQYASKIETSVPIDQTSINKNHSLNYEFNWMWTNPTLSIILRGDAKAIILNNSQYREWQPFDPLDIDPLILSYYSKKKSLLSNNLF